MGQVAVIPTLVDACERVRTFRNDLKTIREAGYTQVDLAELLGVSDRQIQRWERGTHYPQNPVVLVSIMLWAERLRSQQSRSAS